MEVCCRGDETRKDGGDVSFLKWVSILRTMAAHVRDFSYGFAGVGDTFCGVMEPRHL